MWLTVLLLVLFVYRATRLVTDDQWPPSVALRGRVVDRWGDESWQAYLVTCPWCMSLWLGAGIVAVTAQVIDVHAPVLVVGASSAVSGYLSTLEPE